MWTGTGELLGSGLGLLPPALPGNLLECAGKNDLAGFRWGVGLNLRGSLKMEVRLTVPAVPLGAEFLW